MRRECRKRFPRHRLQRKPLVSDSGTERASRTCRGAYRDRWHEVAGNRSRRSRRMGNPQFYVSGKRPMYGNCQQPPCISWLTACVYMMLQISDKLYQVGEHTAVKPKSYIENIHLTYAMDIFWYWEFAVATKELWEICRSSPTSLACLSICTLEIGETAWLLLLYVIWITIYS